MPFGAKRREADLVFLFYFPLFYVSWTDRTHGRSGKTLFISGASRGIGLAIALRAARDKANIAIAAKTATPHPTVRTKESAFSVAGVNVSWE